MTARGLWRTKNEFNGILERVAQLRTCTVSVRDPHGAIHTVRVQAASLFEAAAQAIAAFREQGWAAAALTPAAILRVEVQPPPVVHDVPLRAVEKWTASVTPGPRDKLAKQGR
jgi:hypothetical protein